MTPLKKILKAGTRGSLLAVSQTEQVLELIKKANPEIDFEIVTIKTSGDEGNLEVLGAFVKEVEHALLRGEIDIAIHSYKDMPTALPQGVKIGALPKRGEYRDCLVTLNNQKIEDLPHAAKVGTGSLRRNFQIKALRPDIEVVPIRGNIITRMSKVTDKILDAVVLAGAGLQRVEMDDRITELFTTDQMLPAVAQGILAVQVRSDDDETLALVSKIHDEVTEIAARAERAFLIALGGGCRMPIGAYATVKADKIHLKGMLADEKGTKIERANLEGSKSTPERLGEDLAEILLKRFETNPLH